MNFHRGFDAFDFIRGQTTDHFKPKYASPPQKVQRALTNGGGELEDSMRQYFANVKERNSEADWFSPMVFTRASEFLEVLSEGEPLFLTVDSFDPHEPWDPPEKYVKMYDESYDGKEPYWPRSGPNDYLDERELERMKARYSAEVTMMDRWLGRFLDKMEELGLFDNTLLILLSDHGVAFGEHGITGKPHYALWPEVTDVPFLIRHPEGKKSGQTSDFYASTHDVAPTILGFLGVEPERPMDGEDLSVLFDGSRPEERDHFTLGYNDHAWARDERYVMFAKNDGSNALLYDLSTDPDMNSDVAGSNHDLLNRMWNEYVLKDAGGPLPTYRNVRP